MIAAVKQKWPPESTTELKSQYVCYYTGEQTGGQTERANHRDTSFRSAQKFYPIYYCVVGQDSLALLVFSF